MVPGPYLSRISLSVAALFSSFIIFLIDLSLLFWAQSSALLSVPLSVFLMNSHFFLLGSIQRVRRVAASDASFQVSDYLVPAAFGLFDVGGTY